LALQASLDLYNKNQARYSHFGLSKQLVSLLSLNRLTKKIARCVKDCKHFKSKDL